MKRNANTAATVAVVADNTAWTFTATAAALNGHTFPATYSVARSGDVYVFATVEDIPVRIHVGKASPVYHECFDAAMAAKAAAKPAAKPAKPVDEAAKPAAEPAKPVAKAAKPVAAKPAKQAKPAAEPAKPVAEAAKPAAAKPAKQAKPAAEPAKPVVAKAAKPAAAKPAKQAKPAAEPAKPVAVPDDNAWIGTAIEGKGWRIAFDEAAQRTRVIADAPSAKQKAAIEAAGFYWSATTKSWNKKLTRKAYRAAIALAETLKTLK